MAGRFVPLFSRRTFTFTGLSAGQEFSLVQVKELDVGVYTSGDLLVRVHAATISSTSSHIEVSVHETAPTPEDPAVDFVSSAALATIRLTDSTAPKLAMEGLATPFAARVQVSVLGKRSGSDTVTAVLSATLCMKERG